MTPSEVLRVLIFIKKKRLKYVKYQQEKNGLSVEIIMSHLQIWPFSLQVVNIIDWILYMCHIDVAFK